jgi:hypothetical protein
VHLLPHRQVRVLAASLEIVLGRRRAFIALASIPALLGAHQFIEALVWLWLQGHVPRGIGHVALWAYLLIAFVVLPVFVPLAVIAAESARRRKQVMAPFALIGAVIAVTLLAAMVRGPVGVKLIAVVIIARLTISGFASVWCGWAAVSSAAITLHCRFVRAPLNAPDPGLTDSCPPAGRPS